MALHAALPQMKDIPGGASIERPNDPSPTVVHVIYMSRLPVFFLIADRVGRTMLERVGREAVFQWSVTYLLTIAGPTLLLRLSYHALVRCEWVGAILDGRRHPRVRANAAEPAAATS